MSQPIIGIMLNDRTFNGIVKGRTRHEAIPFYEDAARSLAVKICYFRLRDISLRKMKVRALIPDLESRRYTAVLMPLPSVIHNRAIHFSRSSLRKLEVLHRRGVYLYNRHTRYSKWFIHRLLIRDERLKPHLPETRKAAPAAIRSMMKRYDSLILKPSRGSIGRGIMKLYKKDGKWLLKYRSNKPKRKWRTQSFRSTLPLVLRRALRKKTYLVQQTIPLATYMNRPFDLRVSVQRDRSGMWQVTGIVGKAAPADLFLTNVAQGGTVYTLEHLLSSHPELNPLAVRRSVESLSLSIAEHLGRALPNMADIGLDIGLTDQGFPMFIECNCRDLRYSFQEGGLWREWQNVYYHPVSYGQHVWLNRQLLLGGTADG